jgi:hypothetical protein
MLELSVAWKEMVTFATVSVSPEKIFQSHPEVDWLVEGIRCWYAFGIIVISALILG